MANFCGKLPIQCLLDFRHTQLPPIMAAVSGIVQSAKNKGIYVDRARTQGTLIAPSVVGSEVAASGIGARGCTSIRCVFDRSGSGVGASKGVLSRDENVCDLIMALKRVGAVRTAILRN